MADGHVGRVRTCDVARAARRCLAVALRRRSAERCARPSARWVAADTGAGRLLPWLPVALRPRHRSLFHRRSRARAGGRRSALAAIAALVAIFVRARAPSRSRWRSASPRSRRLCRRDAQDRADRASGPAARPPGTSRSPASSRCARSARSTDRIVVRVARASKAPHRARSPSACALSVRSGTAPPVGAFVEVKARLNPPLRPLRPGGYDFARDLYFQRIGATGFVLGAIKIADAAGRRRALAALRDASIEGMRDAIDARIRAVLPGDDGAIASALITGKRDAISRAGQRRDVHLGPRPRAVDLRLSHGGGRGHRVLRRARAARARFPGSPTRAPIKKWAALAALHRRPRSICCCRARRSRPSARSS